MARDSRRRSRKMQSQDERYCRVERWFGEFRCSIRLPLNEGVLTVWLPKSKASTMRKIEIRQGEAQAKSTSSE